MRILACKVLQLDISLLFDMLGQQSPPRQPAIHLPVKLQTSDQPETNYVLAQNLVIGQQVKESPIAEVRQYAGQCDFVNFPPQPQPQPNEQSLMSLRGVTKLNSR